MKRLFKILGILLLVLLIIFLILGLTQPKEMTITRSAIIKAPQTTVFNQVIKFKNWPNWSPWIEVEPTVTMTYFGIDGQPGSGYAWTGDEIGSGKMSNVKATREQLFYDLEFIKPWTGKASGDLKVEISGKGETKVTWSMTSQTNFFTRAMGFMMKGRIGKDFDRGLELLKEYCEAHPNIEMSKNDVIEKAFPATTFAMIRKKILWSEMQNFSRQAFEQLTSNTVGRTLGPPSTFYFSWDDSTQSTDMAPAFAISGTEPVKDAQLLNIPPMSVCSILCKGGYSNIGRAQQILGQYIAEKGRRLTYTYEEYLVGPSNEADSNQWMTNINFLVK